METHSQNKQKKRQQRQMEIVKDTGVPGLFLIKNFLTEDEEQQLASDIDLQPWKMNRTNTRRVQMYGPWHDEKYEIKRGCIVTPLPQYAKPVEIKFQGILSNFPHINFEDYHFGDDNYTELFVNEYKPEDSLQFHFDHRSTYKEVIFGLSLLSDTVFVFQKNKKELKVNVPRRSLYLMTGPSRNDYKHGMYSHSMSEDRRISLTYRYVNYLREE